MNEYWNDEVVDVAEQNPITSSAEPDSVLEHAQDLALETLRDDVDSADQIGEYLGAEAEITGSGHVLTHRFAAHLPGYVGWHWAVSLSRSADSDKVTVCETVLLPGHGAIEVDAWLPYSERLRPEDLHPGDVVPANPDDDRLVPAYLDSGDEAIAEVAYEIGLGRERVMSLDGRLDTAARWAAGTHGAATAMAKHAPARCGTCGFYLPLAGSMGAAFGGCGNEISPADGSVVNVEFGCGAHTSATPMPDLAAPIVYTPIYDTRSVEVQLANQSARTGSLQEQKRSFANEILAKVLLDAAARRDARTPSISALNSALVYRAVAAAFASRAEALSSTQAEQIAPEQVQSPRRNRSRLSRRKR